MSRQRASTEVMFLLALTCLAARAAGAAGVSSKDLARCAAITAPDARLACYDALAPGKPSTASAPGAPSTSSAPPAQPSDAHADVKAFGLPKPAPVAPPDAPDLIHALVTQVNVGRLDGGSISVLLDNGQSWLVQATEVDLKAGDSVTIKRASLGSYLLTTTTRHSYRVRRLQ